MFFLVPSNETLSLADRLPDLGASWASGSTLRKDPTRPSILPLASFSESDWRPLQHVLVHALARHPMRRASASEANYCIVAAPTQHGLYPTGHSERVGAGVAAAARGGCGSVGTRWRAWTELCPGKPLLVVDTVDADYRGFRLCNTLWDRSRCLNEQSTALLRLVGSPPLTTHPGEPSWKQRSLLAPCPALSVPWLSHARAPIALPPPHARTVRIAGAYSTFQHGMAIKLGWADWRRDLRNSCHGLGNTSRCTHLYQSMSGKNARSAIELYARSVFCLQPPGDVVARGAMVDALSVGCIPVFFHPAQAALWPLHWSGARASVTFDWTDPHVRNATVATVGRERIGRAAADVALRHLLELSDAEVARLQRAVARAAPRMYYRVRPDTNHWRGLRGTSGAVTTPLTPSRPLTPPDAVDVLVAGLGRQLYSRRHSGNLSWPTVLSRLRPEARNSMPSYSLLDE